MEERSETSPGGRKSKKSDSNKKTCWREVSSPRTKIPDSLFSRRSDVSLSFFSERFQSVTMMMIASVSRGGSVRVIHRAAQRHDVKRFISSSFFNPTEEHRTLRDMLRTFVDREVRIMHRALHVG